MAMENKAERKRVVSGIQPTAASFHLGNYVGALQAWPALQDTHAAFYMVADLHSLTLAADPAVRRERTLSSAAQLVALGLTPAKSTLFLQSQVPEHAQLAWILNCLTSYGEARRMTQFKAKSSAEQAEDATVGLFTYPVLQAADILLYQAHEVPVGEDQRQHLQLTRELAKRFNQRHGLTFEVPTPLLAPTAKIFDLQKPTAKMSKSTSSAAGLINLLDTPTAAAKKIRSAVTDGGSAISFDPEGKPGVSNLLSIYSALTGQPLDALVQAYEGKGYGQLKVDLSVIVGDFVEAFSAKTAEVLADRGQLEATLAAGAEQARATASLTLAAVQAKLGLVP